MKFFFVTLLFIELLFVGSVYAESCEVPKFLETEKTYVFSNNKIDMMIGKVLKIDHDSCWIMIDWKEVKSNNSESSSGGTAWFNLKSFISIFGPAGQ